MSLSEQQRDEAMRDLVQQMFVRPGATATLTTTDLRHLIDDLDDFVEANSTAINQSIRTPLRGNATLSQKALALAIVAMKRGGLI